MNKLLYIFLVAISACTSSIQREDILGTWTFHQDESKHPKSDITDKITFYPNDSFKVEMFYKGSLNNSFTGRYILDESKRMLTTISAGHTTNSEIITLTKNHFSIQHDSVKTRSNFVRIK